MQKLLFLMLFGGLTVLFSHGPNHTKAEEANKRGNYNTALKYSFIQLDEDLEKFGAYANETMITYGRLGIYAKKLKQYEPSLAYNLEALKIQKKILDTNDILIATTYNNIGGVYSKLKNYKEALSYYFKSLKIRRLTLGKNHRTEAITLNNIAKVYRKQKKYEKALEYYRHSLDIRQETLDKNDYSIALAHSNIGLVYFKQGKYNQALEELDKALEIRKAIFGETHSFTRKTQKNIDYIKKKMLKG